MNITAIRKGILTSLIASISTLTLGAQNRTFNGTIIDSETGAPVVGAAVMAGGNGTVTDLDGNFSISVSESGGSLKLSCLGYKDITIQTGKVASLGTITIQPDEYKLSDVIVSGQFAISRKTPVVASNVRAIEIEEKLGNQEFTEALKYTPGIHVNRQGGGWGDSEIFMRGFDNTNIAVMVNGIQVNDMETGTMYWSDWASLSDVTSVMQTQRGIGANKISTSAVVGTVNIITKGIEQARSGSVSYALGNDGYNKVTFATNTGLMSNGWALSILGSYSSGNGYVQGTDFQVYNYFLNLSKRIGENHQPNGRKSRLITPSRGDGQDTTQTTDSMPVASASQTSTANSTSHSSPLTTLGRLTRNLLSALTCTEPMVTVAVTRERLTRTTTPSTIGTVPITAFST